MVQTNPVGLILIDLWMITLQILKTVPAFYYLLCIFQVKAPNLQRCLDYGPIF